MIGITTPKMIGQWRNIAINLTRSRSTAWPAGHRGLRTAPASPGAGRREPPDIAAACIIDGRGALAVGLSAADDPASGIVIGDRALAVGGRAAEAAPGSIVERALLLRRCCSRQSGERQRGDNDRALESIADMPKAGRNVGL